MSRMLTQIIICWSWQRCQCGTWSLTRALLSTTSPKNRMNGRSYQPWPRCQWCPRCACGRKCQEQGKDVDIHEPCRVIVSSLIWTSSKEASRAWESSHAYLQSPDSRGLRQCQLCQHGGMARQVFNVVSLSVVQNLFFATFPLSRGRNDVILGWEFWWVGNWVPWLESAMCTHIAIRCKNLTCWLDSSEQSVLSIYRHE